MKIGKKPEYSDMVREAMAAYGSVKEQGEYVVEDVEKLPEECRAELIDGVIYEMHAPYTIHQTICMELFVRLREYIRGNDGKCVPFAAPVDVQLDCDNKTMVQPDVLIICDRKKNTGKRIWGAPDFIAEILSESTRRKDIFIKTEKYFSAGVKEYWIVDPKKRNILVYNFAKREYPVIYGFDDVIPVNIFNGACRIDFREIHEYLKDIYEY